LSYILFADVINKK